MTEISYEVREKDLIAFNEHQLQNSERIQKIIRRHQGLIPGIIAVIALLLFFYFKDIPSSIYVMLLAMAWGMGVPHFLKLSMRKQIRKLYTDKEKASILGRYTLRTEPDGLVEVSDDQESKMAWKELLRVEVEKKYVFIHVSLSAALIIPRETVAKECNLHEFVKTVDESIEAAS